MNGLTEVTNTWNEPFFFSLITDRGTNFVSTHFEHMALQDYKNAGRCLSKTTCFSKTAKYCSDWIVNSAPQLLWNHVFGGNFGKVGIVEFNFQAIDELVYSWRMETLVIVESANPNFYSNLSFCRNWGCKFDNLVLTHKIIHRRISSLWLMSLKTFQKFVNA